MPPEPSTNAHYFDTPARAERLQLLLHLVRNAGEVIYLRAPGGAGKTRFARRLLDLLGDDVASVWIRAGHDLDIPAATVDQLELEPIDALQWPGAVLAGLDDRDLLVIVDDADELDLGAVERLSALHQHGGRLLLLGRGGLAQATGNWDVQFVDLPSFDQAETAAFLRHQAANGDVEISDDLAAALHRAAYGLPGPLLDALHEVINRARGRPVARSAADGTGRGSAWRWLAGATVVLLLGGVLVYQDQINALFEPDRPTLPTGTPQTTEPAPTVAPDRQTAAPVAAAEPPGGGPQGAAPIAERTADRVPPIALPEISGGVDLLGGSVAPDAGAPAAAETTDPLGAVLRDALVAADPPAPDMPEAGAADPPEGAAEQVARPPVVAADSTGESASGPASGANSLTTPDRDLPSPAAGPARTPAEPGAAPPARPAPSGPPAQPDTADTEWVQFADVKVPARRSGGAWLRSRAPGRYTLQLVGARDRAAVEDFIREHAVPPPYAIFERQLSGSPWYSLVAGDYPDRASALAARDRLPAGLRHGDVWPRTFDSILKAK